MQLPFDYPDYIVEELTDAINHEILISCMTNECGWHKIILSNKFDEDNAVAWAKENMKYKYIGKNGVWAFENKDESIEFILRYS